MTNKEVLGVFVGQQKGVATNLSTDGQVLLSYGWYELGRWINGELFIRSGIAYSRTTARQRSQLVSACVRAGVSFKISSQQSLPKESRMLL